MAAGISFEMKTETAIFIAAGLAVASLCAVSFLALFRANNYSGQPCAEERADEFEDAYTRWLIARRDFQILNHNDCAPMAASYGLTEETADKIRARVRRDFERSA